MQEYRPLVCTLLIDFRWEIKGLYFFSFFCMKRASEFHVPWPFWSAIQPLPGSGSTWRAVSPHAPPCLHVCSRKAPWCWEHSRGDSALQWQCLPAARLSSHLAGSSASSRTSDIPPFIKWNGAWNSEFGFVYMLTMAHSWLLERFLSHCHTDDLSALMGGKSSFSPSAAILCFWLLQYMWFTTQEWKGSFFFTLYWSTDAWI